MGLIEGASYLARFMSEQWKDADTINRLQEARLESALENAYKAPFYRNLMDERGIRAKDGHEAIRCFPTTTKESIQSQPESFLAPSDAKSPGISHETTGSRGKPLRILMDQKTATLRSSILLSNLISCGLKPWALTAQLITPHCGLPLGRRISHGILPFLSLNIYDSEKANLEAIRKAGAKALAYYPSAMVLLASENRKSQRPIKLDRILSGAELLAPDWRRLLEESFSCPVFNMYGSWEFGPIAWECPEEHSLHVNSGSFHMELLGSNDRPCRHGVGRVVLTSLSNRAMPLVRYELGDLAAWGGQCKCGRGLKVLKSVEGRADDLVVLPSGNVQSPLAFRFTDLRCVADCILMYQLVQENEGLLVFRFVPGKANLQEASKEEIRQRILEACKGEAVRVEFEETDRIPRNRSGKLDRLISKVPRRRMVRTSGCGL